MKFFKKILLGALLALLLVSITPTSVQTASAAGSILPTLDAEIEALYPCDPNHEDWGEYWGLIFGDEDWLKEQVASESIDEVSFVLACALKTGHIQFWMVPYFAVFALEFLLSIAALLAILMIIVGAYFYIAGGLTDDKEKGKTIIKYAIGGLIVTTLSWVIVNVLLLALTS